jgi:thioredoxin-like negative regulator of GroEL
MRKTILLLLAFLAVYSFLQVMILGLNRTEGWSDGIQALNADEFESVVSDGPTWMVVHLWAPWCSICKQAIPDYNQAATEYPEEIVFYHLNQDENPEWVETYQLDGAVPTSMLFYEGQEISRHSGRLSPSLLRSWIGHNTGLKAEEQP